MRCTWHGRSSVRSVGLNWGKIRTVPVAKPLNIKVMAPFRGLMVCALGAHWDLFVGRFDSLEVLPGSLPAAASLQDSLLSDLPKNPLLQYMDRLAPSSQQTMRYILQDAADRLGFVDCNVVDVPWHRLEPGHEIGRAHV